MRTYKKTNEELKGAEITRKKNRIDRVWHQEKKKVWHQEKKKVTS